MSYAKIDSITTLTSGVTTVDCQKQVRSWGLLRSLFHLLIPSCNCIFVKENENDFDDKKCCDYNNCYYQIPCSFLFDTIITGTIFGYRHGKVRFCIQENPKCTTPMLLLELAISTTSLAKEMRGGFLRISLECNTSDHSGTNSCSLLSMPIWSMFCNGRKVGFAMNKSPTKVDMVVLQQMKSVVVGAGCLNGGELKSEDDIKYLRGKFHRVQGSSNSESFHLIDPDGNVGQDLSFFFFRSH